jgi:hypothetical protein
MKDKSRSFFSILVAAVIGGIIGLVLLVLFDGLLFGLMWFACDLRFSSGADVDQLLWSNLGLSALIAAPLGLLFGAIVGINYSSRNRNV